MNKVLAQQSASPAAPNGKQLEVAMLLYPNLTLLDLVGPQMALTGPARVHLVWKTRDLVTSDGGISIQPSMTLQDCPADLDVLFVPGGGGMIEVMKDAEVMAFVRDRGARAKYVTSVCSGSMILGAAGLLRGYKATSHWAVVNMLSYFGAEYTKGRVVIDRNRFTGGGVTAGIDFGLTLLAHLRGEGIAKLKQLGMEYNRDPPFHAGSPDEAGPALTQQMMQLLEPTNRRMREIAENWKKE